MDQNRIMALQALSDAFGGLRSAGGGNAGPQRALPMALSHFAQQDRQNKAREALKAAQGGEGGNPAFSSPAFQAYAQQNPEQALQLMAQQAITPEAQPDPWRDKRVVGGSVVQASPDGGVQSIYSAPQAQGAQFRPASTEEAARYGAKAGQVDLKTGRFYPINPPQGMEMVSDGAGGFTFRQGSGVGGDAPTAVKNEAIKGRNAFDSIMKGLDDYEQFTSEGGAVIPGKKKDRLDVARRSLQLQMKELFNLGVLNGPDLALMDQLLVDMTSLENNALDIMGVADLGERTQANVAQLRQMMTDLIEPKLKSAGIDSGAQASPLAPLTDLSDADLDAQIRRLQGQ